MNYVLANASRAEGRGPPVQFIRPTVRRHGAWGRPACHGVWCSMPWCLCRAAAASHSPSTQRRVDISKLSGVGISHAWPRFLAATQEYLPTFSAVFDGMPLQTQPVNWGERG